MPTPTEIDAIETEFAKQYGIDLESVRNDQKVKLQTFVINSQLQKIDSPDILSTKIYNEGDTYTYNDSPAFVRDLETPHAYIPPDPRLFPQRVEQNLEEAIRYSQNCLQIRQQYGETAKLRNDTRFKGEEFIRLDLVHLEEVKAGLYRLPWQEAADEGEALETAISEASAQEKICTETTSDLSDGSVNAYIGNVTQLAENSTTFNKALICDGTSQTTEYRTRIEHAAWLQSFPKSHARTFIAAEHPSQRRCG